MQKNTVSRKQSPSKTKRARLAAGVLAALLTLFPMSTGQAPLSAQTTHYVTSNADTGAGSLREILGLVANGDTILFALPGGGNTITLDSNLPTLMVDNLSFGPDMAVAIIDGDNAYQIFNVNADFLSLSAITLQNGSSFTGGGAVFLGGTNLSLNSTTFLNNTAMGSGGAVAFTSTGPHTLINTGDTVFTGNSADIDGGAISAGGALTLTNTNGGTLAFTGNQSLGVTGFGGAVSVNGDVTIGSGVTFGGATAADGNAANRGGAIFVGNGTTLSLDDTTFQNNTATGNGGAISFANIGTSTLTNTGDTVFLGNMADGGGGAIDADGALTLTNTNGGTITFTGNDGGSGGAVCANGDVVIGSGITFGGANAADGNTAVYGGAVYLTAAAAEISLDGTRFQNNSATGSGGALYINNTGGEVALTNTGDTVFSGNTSVSSGGAIYAEGTLTFTNINGGTISFTGNQATYQGGAIDVAGGDLVLMNSGDVVFTGNVSDRGAAICAGGDITLTNTGSGTITFSGNRADIDTLGIGGAIEARANLIIGSGVTFENNFASSQGGAVYHRGNSLSLDGTTFQNNSATSSGGAVHFSSVATLTNTGDTVFSDNTAATGGAIYAGDLTITGTGSIAFSGNTATQGGDIYAIGNVTLNNGITIKSDIDTEIWSPVVNINYGVTLEFDLQNATDTTTNLVITGAVNNVDGGTMIDWTTWKTGTFTLISASDGGLNVEDYSVDTTGFGSRQSATLSVSGNNLILTAASDNNLDLVWTGGSDGNWNTTATGNWSFTAPDAVVTAETYNPNDFVTFTGAGSGDVLVGTSGQGVQVSGMEITGGDYVFSGGAIRGATPDSTGQTVTGQLFVLAGATAIFNNQIDFASGVYVNGGTATFNNTLSSSNDGLRIMSGTATIGDSAAFSHDTLPYIENNGSLIFDRTTSDFTLTSNIMGTGTVIKTGAAKLTLDATGGLNSDGAHYSNDFVQRQGDVELAAGMIWNGDFTQQKTAGTFLAAAGTAIIGDVDFGSAVEMADTLTIDGELGLNGATLVYNLAAANVSNKIDVTGNLSYSPLDTTLKLASWNTGTYTLITAAGGIDATKFLVDTSSFGSRQTAGLSGSATELILTTSTNNLNLVWTGGSDGNWNTTATGNWSFTAPDAVVTAETYNPNDFVTFTGAGSGDVLVGTSGQGVQVSGMEITGGDYVFSGGAIRGATPDSTGQTVTGKLVVSGGDTVMRSAVDFVNGIDVTAGSVEFQNSIAASGGLMIGSVANVTIGDGAALDALADIANDGTLVFHRETDDFTLSDNLTGTGSVWKTGNARLTLDSDSMAGNFVQKGGDVALAAGKIWNGNVTQESTGGTFFAGNFSTVSGDAGFSGTVDVDENFHVDGDLFFDGATLNIDVAAQNVSDSISVTGNVSFGTNVNTVNLNNWESGLFTLITAGSVDAIDGKWIVRYGGAVVDADEVRYISDGTNLQIDTNFAPPPDRIIVEWDGDEEGDPRGTVWGSGSVPDGGFLVVDREETELITVDGDIDNLGGMEISTDVVIRPAQKDDNIVLTGSANPELGFLESNGRLAITGGTVELDLDTDFENGNLLSGGEVIPGRDKTFGTFEQNADDIENSRGQILVKKDSPAKISPKKSLDVQNRYILQQDADFMLDVASGEEMNISNVNVTDTEAGQEPLLNGGAIVLLSGSTLTLDGNITIKDNSTELAGGGLFVDPATVIFDSTKGHTAIYDNRDSTGLNAIALEGVGNELRFVGGATALSGGVDIRDSIRALPGSTDNEINVRYTNKSDFVQFGAATHEPGDAAKVSVYGGILRLVQGGTLETENGGNINVAADGALAGGGHFTATNVEIAGTLSADHAVLTSTSSIIGRHEQIGQLTLTGNVTLNGSRIAAELKGSNESDKITVDGGLTYGAEQNIVDVNSWSEGTFTVLETTNAAELDDTKFALRIGGENVGSRQTAALVQNGNLLQITTAMGDTDRRRLTWTADADGYLSTSSANNWTDDFGTAERFNHSDYLVFDAAGRQGDVVLGAADGTLGGRTVSGLLISDGNYTFVGGDLFGVQSTFDHGSGPQTVSADLLIGGGNIGFDNNVFFEGNIEILNEANVTLTSRKAFHAEGDFLLSSNASLTLAVGDHLIRGKTVTLDGAVVLTDEPLPTTHRTPVFHDLIVATDGGLDSVRLESLFNFTQGLLNREALASVDGRSMSLQYTATPLGEYADKQGFAPNEEEIARYLQDTFNNWEWEEFELTLMELNDEQLAALFAQLSNSVLHAEAKTMALSNPYRAVSQRSFEADPCPRSTCSTNGFWFAANHSDLRQDGDGLARRYGISRTGMNIGLDRKVTPSTHIGFLFDYGNPRLHQEGSRIESDDHKIGFYVRKRFQSVWEANAFLAFGNQRYDGDRVTLDGIAKSKYDGESLHVTAELIRKLALSREFVFLPTLAFDYQSAKTDRFSETESDFGQAFESSRLSRSVLRIGLNAQWRINDRFRLDTRLQYGRQVGGSDTPSIRGVYVTSTVENPVTLHGVKLGRDLFNVGVGGRYFLAGTENAFLYGNYDLDRGNRSLAHSGELGFQYRW